MSRCSACGPVYHRSFSGYVAFPDEIGFEGPMGTSTGAAIVNIEDERPTIGNPIMAVTNVEAQVLVDGNAGAAAIDADVQDGMGESARWSIERALDSISEVDAAQAIDLNDWIESFS